MIYLIIYLLSIILPFCIVVTILKREALDIRGEAILFASAFTPGFNTLFSLAIIYLFIKGDL